jgi:thioredoxin reductase (NADPH)
MGLTAMFSWGGEELCRALLVATGVTLLELQAPGVKELTGAGVYYGAALTEAANYKDQPVFVVGGANSAGQGAMFFSRFASHVSVVIRVGSLEAGMSQYLVDQLRANPKVEVLRAPHRFGGGDNRLKSVVLREARAASEEWRGKDQ